MNHSTGKATKPEVERIKRLVLEVGCICCLLRFGVYNGHVEIHHIVRGNRRLGHWYTLPLCTAHHRAKGEGPMTSIANGSKAFTAMHGTELDLWLKVQHMLKLSDELPTSKRVPRRSCVEVAQNRVALSQGPQMDAEVVTGGGAADAGDDRQAVRS